MARADVLLASTVGVFALFVGAKVATRPRSADTAKSVTSPGTDPVNSITTVSTHQQLPGSNTVRTQTSAPERDLAQIRARIAETPGTYMNDMLDDLNGSLVRWPDKRETGLRIWVQSITPVTDWDQRYAQMARDAFDDWGRDALPIRFDFVNDSATSDIRIVWREKFAPEQGARVGLATRTNDQHGWLVEAQIDVAVHDSTGRTIPPTALAGIVRHEAGHALGMGHSRDPKTKMFPFEMTAEIAAADRATMRLLYSLPPGPARP